MTAHPAPSADPATAGPGPRGAQGPVPYHSHDFLGVSHGRNQRRTLAVVALCGVMLVVEIGAGLLFHSMALLADGIHMATHAGAMTVAAAAYIYARRHNNDPRFTYGTGKIGDLAAFGSAVFLASTALLVGIESVQRLLAPEPIAFDQAIPVAALGLAANLLSAWLLRDEHAHVHDEADDHRGHHDDHNLRAAYIHVISDAAVSLLAIAGLLAGRELGWIWMDPVMGVIGALMIARWAVELLRVTGAVLLDMSPGKTLAATIRALLETDGDQVVDLHVWRLGPGHNAAALVVLSASGRPPSAYRARLAGVATLSHLTIEVEPLAKG